MSSHIGKLSGDYYKTADKVKDKMKSTGWLTFGVESKRAESIFGDGQLEAGTTKKEFMARMEDIGFDEKISGSCWELLNYDTDGDSADVIDAEELEILMQEFGSDINGKVTGNKYTEITVGSLYTHLTKQRDAVVEDGDGDNNTSGSDDVSGSDDDEQTTKTIITGGDDIDGMEDHTGLTPGEYREAEEVEVKTGNDSKDVDNNSKSDESSADVDAGDVDNDPKSDKGSDSKDISEKEADIRRQAAAARAAQIHAAVEGRGTTIESVNEILLQLKDHPRETSDVVKIYHEMFGTNLYDDLEDDIQDKETKYLKDDYGNLYDWKAVINSGQQGETAEYIEKCPDDDTLAELQANAIWGATGRRDGTDEDAVYQLLIPGNKGALVDDKLIKTISEKIEKIADNSKSYNLYQLLDDELTSDEFKKVKDRLDSSGYIGILTEDEK